MSVVDNYQSVLRQIQSKALECGRSLNDVSLVAVTKSVEWEDVQQIFDLGQRDFGENRLPEALKKMSQAPQGCFWHFIGTLQKNKVRKVIESFSLIHSVDSFELAQKISDCSRELGRDTHILLQSNTSGEGSKHGNTPEQWKECFEAVASLPNISIDGLMTMAPLTEDEAVIRDCFRKLRVLRDELNYLGKGRLKLYHLSMGMSHDYKIAIEEGATLLRIGSAIFSVS